MKEALGADSGSGGKRDPYSELFSLPTSLETVNNQLELRERSSTWPYQEAPVGSLCDDAQGAGLPSGRQQQNRAPLPLPGF